MLERHYKIEDDKVFELAPTGVAAYNISGQTLHRFFGLTNVALVPNFALLDRYVEQYPRMILLIDEYSMIGSKMPESISEALTKVTNRNRNMGGIRTIFFGDIVQLLPVKANEGKIWEFPTYNTVNRYQLRIPVKQNDAYFVSILNKIKTYKFDQSVIEFINSRTVAKSESSSRCLRLHTTLERVTAANERDYNSFPGGGKSYEAQDNFTGTAGTARATLNETRLVQRLPLNKKMPLMLIQNLNLQGGWVNGTIAQIEYLEDGNICLRKMSNNSNSV
ncbi:ATP-dependent DNA helicase PIF1 [Choanephora cucurbitarum]|uniref:ATP-dependent DNA helicase n=1 Tax=Choanephora cucurbitarum TaxID=101091 RepID=A0A1C7MVN5_9FUNG|nr:ATP-dependent DNA helicase PIF1 [Choanephora cucurbitarum]